MTDLRATAARTVRRIRWRARKACCSWCCGCVSVIMESVDELADAVNETPTQAAIDAAKRRVR